MSTHRPPSQRSPVAQLPQLPRQPSEPHSRSRHCERLHRQAPADRRLDGHGAVDRIREAWALDFTLLPAQGAALPFSPAERRNLFHEADGWFATNRAILEERIRAGRMRDGPGDLRLEHVFLTTPVAVIDPLELAWLRIADVALDVGFLAMELDELGRSDMARRLVSGYTARTGDAGLARVLPFFQRHLAVVRARVECIRAQRLPDERAEERRSHLERSRRLAFLAMSYALSAP